MPTPLPTGRSGRRDAATAPDMSMHASPTPPAASTAVTTTATAAYAAKARIMAPSPPPSTASPTPLLLRVRILGQNPVFCHGVRALLDGRAAGPPPSPVLQAHLGDDARTAAAPDNITIIAFTPEDDLEGLRALVRRTRQDRERARLLVASPAVGVAPPVLLIDTPVSASGAAAVERALTLAVIETDMEFFLSTQDPAPTTAQAVAAAATSGAGMRCSPRLFPALLRAVRRHCAALPLEEGVSGALAPAPGRIGLLTAREVEVARLIASEGLSDAEIADRLGVSVNTIRAHVARLRRKLGVTARGKIGAALRRHLY